MQAKASKDIVCKQQMTWYSWEIKFVLRKVKRNGKGISLGQIKRCIKYQAKKYWRKYIKYEVKKYWRKYINYEAKKYWRFEELYRQICVSKLMSADCNE